MNQIPPNVIFDEKVFETVQKCFCDALELDPEDVTYQAKILDDLGAESLDLLDVVFRLERSFNIQIPRGGVEAQAKLVDGEPGEINGRLTEVGAVRLRQLMPEVPAEEIHEGMKSTEIGRLFRVGTFYNLVYALLHKDELKAALEKYVAEQEALKAKEKEEL